MGTTLTTLASGSLDYDLVIAIEGYPNLLTTGDPAAAVTAWSGTDWTTALGGLYVDLNNQHTLHPWEPFQAGPSLTFHVADTGGDTFGIDVHRVANTVKTSMTASADRAAAAISVQSTSAFPSAGEAYIGGECFFYSSKTSTSFGVFQRGRYSPFAAGGTGAPNFAEHHRFGNVDYAPLLSPIVSQLPRIWRGRWFGVWMHRKINGVLDVRAQAQCIYAGTIDEPADDENTMMTVVTGTHVLDLVKDAVIGRDMWSAKITEGIYLGVGVTITFTDTIFTGTVSASTHTANPLVVVASGASGANQFNAGYYSVDALASVMNTWWASEKTATRAGSLYTIDRETFGGAGSGGPTRMAITDAFNTFATWALGMPQILAIFLGYDASVPDSAGTALTSIKKTIAPPSTLFGIAAPYRTLVFEGTTAFDNHRIAVTNTSGTFVDNFAWLPSTARPATSGGTAWGLFLFDGQILVFGTLVGNELQRVTVAPALMSGLKGTSQLYNYGRRYDQDDQGTIEIKQVYAFDQSFAAFWKSIMFSTGTAGYNDATYDVYGYGIGIGIPAALLSGFAASVDALAVADAGLQCIIDKPTKLSELLNVDLILRRTSLVWKQGGLRMVSWSSPSSASGVTILDETNKGEPPDTQTAQRSTTVLASDWVRNVVKIQYNRNAQTGDYLSTLTLEDRTAIDDAGGQAKPITLPARNAFADSANVGAGVQSLLPAFLAYMPFFSNPVRKLQRSINSTLFEQLAPGDVVTVSDSFARDPTTGARGIAARPGVVVRAWYTLGGQRPDQPDQVTPMAGEVDIIFIDAISSATAVYSPSARIDDTASSSGFSAGYNSSVPSIRCYAHKYSESSEPHDAARFAAGDIIEIVEIDPSNAASPTVWTNVTVVSQSGDDIVLSAVLGSPTWDATKKYRIRSTDYTAAAARQRVNAYQADDATGLVESVAQPFVYSAPTVAGYTFVDHTALFERHSARSYGDGHAFDTGFEHALAVSINNLIDHKTARQSPSLGPLQTAANAGGYELLTIEPIFISVASFNGSALRGIAVAPLYKSATGASVTLRVTLTTRPPSDNTLNDCARPESYVEHTWTTTSTSLATGAEALLDVSSLPAPYGEYYLWIEGTNHCATHGLALCVLRERTFP